MLVAETSFTRCGSWMYQQRKNCRAEREATCQFLLVLRRNDALYCRSPGSTTPYLAQSLSYLPAQSSLLVTKRSATTSLTCVTSTDNGYKGKNGM